MTSTPTSTSMSPPAPEPPLAPEPPFARPPLRPTVLAFGLLSAGLSIATLAATVPLIHTSSIEWADVLGYTAIVLAALITFFGIRSYRERAAGGRMTFGRGFLVGLLITAISSISYAAVFELVYFQLVPDLGERLVACMVERVRIAGASAQEVDATARQAQMMKTFLDHPLLNPAVTLVQSFPIGLLASVVSAAILRRR